MSLANVATAERARAPTPLDLLVGNGWVRKEIDAERSVSQLVARWEDELDKCNILRRRFTPYS